VDVMSWYPVAGWSFAKRQKLDGVMSVGYESQFNDYTILNQGI